MAVPVFQDEFTTCAVEPTLTPEWPKMQGNTLECLSNGTWKFQGMVRYPSGKPKHFHMLLPPAQEGVTRGILAGESFWKDMWETLIICMQGEGEGLGVKMPGTRH